MLSNASAASPPPWCASEIIVPSTAAVSSVLTPSSAACPPAADIASASSAMLTALRPDILKLPSRISVSFETEPPSPYAWSVAVMNRSASSPVMFPALCAARESSAICAAFWYPARDAF